jgi:hypothetical protein
MRPLLQPVQSRLQRALRKACAGVVAAAVPLLLVACGGGGDGGGAEAPATVYNLDAAVTQAFAAPLQIDGLTARDAQGNVYTLSLHQTPGADALFEGALRKTALQTITVTAGSTSSTENATFYYVTGPFAEVGAIDSAGGYSVSVHTGDLPTAARVGDSGPLSNDTAYTDSSKATVAATAVTSWSLEADTDSTAFACTKAVMQMTDPPATASQTTCLRIDTAGKVNGGRVTVTIDGFTMVFS